MRRFNQSEIESFLYRWHQEQSGYEAWGQFVKSHAVHILSTSTTVHLPVEPGWRLKEEKSLLTKAFYRQKPYVNPWAEIEDKVGVRLVVMNDAEVATVRDCLLACPAWNGRVDRDLTQDEYSDPNVFEYTACHVICTSTNQHETIPLGIACEVQIKTLLQLAWGEASHHTIYKPIIEADWDTVHAIAKGKALVDIAGDYFASVYAKVEVLIGSMRESTKRAKEMYERYITPPPRLTELEGRILQCIEPILAQTDGSQLEDWVQQIMLDYPELPNTIATRSMIDPFFAQPSIICLYALVKYRSNSVQESEFAPLFTTIEAIKTDMGMGGIRV